MVDGLLGSIGQGVQNFFGGFGGGQGMPGMTDEERKYLQGQNVQSLGRMLMVLGMPMTAQQRSQAITQMVGNMPDPTQQLGRLQEMKLRQMQLEQAKRQQEGLANFGNLLRSGGQPPMQTPAPAQAVVPQSGDEVRAPLAPQPAVPLTPQQQTLTSPLPGITGQQFQIIQGIGATQGEEAAQKAYTELALDNLKPRKSDLPNDVILYQLAQNDPKFAEFLRSKSQTNINLGDKATQFTNEEVTKLLMKDFQAGKSAVGELERVNRIRQLLDQGIITGFGANGLITLGQAAQQYGLTANNPIIANSQTALTELARGSLEAAKMLEGQGQITDAERRLLADVAGGRIDLDEQAIRNVLEITERIATRTVQSGRNAADILREDVKGTAKERAFSIRDPNFEPFNFGQPTQQTQPQKRQRIDINGNVIQ